MVDITSILNFGMRYKHIFEFWNSSIRNHFLENNFGEYLNDKKKCPSSFKTRTKSKMTISKRYYGMKQGGKKEKETVTCMHLLRNVRRYKFMNVC